MCVLERVSVPNPTTATVKMSNVNGSANNKLGGVGPLSRSAITPPRTRFRIRGSALDTTFGRERKDRGFHPFHNALNLCSQKKPNLSALEKFRNGISTILRSRTLREGWQRTDAYMPARRPQT